MVLLLLVVMLLLMVRVLMVVRVAVGDVRAGAAAGEVAGLLSAEEVSNEAGGDRCCRRVVNTVQQGRRQGHRTTRDERVRMKIRGDGGACLVGADRISEPRLARLHEEAAAAGRGQRLQAPEEPGAFLCAPGTLQGRRMASFRLARSARLVRWPPQFDCLLSTSFFAINATVGLESRRRKRLGRGCRGRRFAFQTSRSLLFL